MPIIKGGGAEAREANFHELRHGKTYARTARKFGKKRAQKQVQAIALKAEREPSHPRKKKRGFFGHF